jgi:predicted patatin/cPLA2 family phospholipase
MEEIPSTLELLSQRIKSNSQPLNRDDPYRISYVPQGGAMRGVISSGAGVGIEAVIGETEPFDQSNSTSAGSFCVGALMSRKTVDAASIYYEELRDDFIRLRQIGRNRIVDLSLLMDAVTNGEKEYDFDRILNSPVETNIYATSVNDAKKVRFIAGSRAKQLEYTETKDAHIVPCKNRQDLVSALEATAHLTWYAGPPVEYNDMLLMDGGITAGRLPVQEAIEDGCTHVLVVSTDKEIDPMLYKRKIEEVIAHRAIRRRYPLLAQSYWYGIGKHRDSLRLIKQAEDKGITIPKIDVIKADKAYIPSSRETDPHKLYLAAKAGEEAVFHAFKQVGISRQTDSTVRLPRF